MSDWLLLPPWADWIIAAGALVLVLLVALRAWREKPNIMVRRQFAALLLRGLIILILLWVALNPTAIRPAPLEGRPRLLVLLDRSASMTTTDVDGQSRFSAAVDNLLTASVRRSLEQTFDVDIELFDESSEPAGFDSLSTAGAVGQASELGAALTAGVIDQADRRAQAGVMLISDGRATSSGVEEAGQLALASSVPLWTWSLGGQVPRRDLWLETPASELLVFSDSEAELNAAVKQVGFENRTFALELECDGQVVQRFEVDPRNDGGQVRAVVKAPVSGEQHYRFRLPALEGEADTQNNQHSIFVRTVGHKVRVFLAEGQPSWDTKFLVQALKRGQRVDLTAVYRLGANRMFAVVTHEGQEVEPLDATDLFPRSSEDFAQYDLVILGRGCEAFFDDQTAALLTQFVAERGGSLVFSRGKSYDGRFPLLAKLDPVVWGQGVSPAVKLSSQTMREVGPLDQLAPDGNLDAMLDRLPRFEQTQLARGVKPLAIVMAGGQPVHATGSQNNDDSLVLLAYQLYGQGRVLTVNAAGLWRWAFRDRGQQQDEFVYDRLWSGLIRWLMAGSDFLAGQQIALRSDRRTYTDRQPVRFMIRTRQIDPELYKPTLSIVSADGQQTRIDPRRDPDGYWLCELGPLNTGAYHVTLESNLGSPQTLTTDIEVTPSSIEHLQRSADPDLMRQLAEVSGGKVLQQRDLGRFDDLYQQWRVEQRLADDKMSLWDRGWWLVLALVLLGGEWYLRRKEGLL